MSVLDGGNPGDTTLLTCGKAPSDAAKFVVTSASAKCSARKAHGLARKASLACRTNLRTKIQVSDVNGILSSARYAVKVAMSVDEYTTTMCVLVFGNVR